MAKIQFRLDLRREKERTHWLIIAKKAWIDSGMAGSSITQHHQVSVSLHLLALLLSFGSPSPCGGTSDQ